MQVVEQIAGHAAPVALWRDLLCYTDKLDPKIPFVKREVRQAMNKPVNRQAIADNLLGGKVQPHRVMGFHPQLDSAIGPVSGIHGGNSVSRTPMGTTRPRRRRS